MTFDQKHLTTHQCSSTSNHDRCSADNDLLSSLTIRNVTFKNRIVVSPMCQYSAVDGFADDWHLVHLGSRAVGGASLVFTEATAVTAEGRISPGDLGLWSDNHIEPLARIARFIDRMHSIPGIQLAHAGRKSSCAVPWLGGEGLSPKQGGWPIVAPSAIPFSELNALPEELSKSQIGEIIDAFKKAAQRALRAGFKVIEIHGAHGYLLNEFLSPLVNQRSDEYGGSLANRMRLICQVTEAIRSVIPNSMPLFVRISATDWVEGGWDIEQSIILAKELKKLGVDLIDCSSGGVVPYAQIPIGPNYQVPLASDIREKGNILTGAVGLITDAYQANDIITSGKADLIFIAREFLREPYWALKAEQIINESPHWPTPYGYAVKRRTH